MQWNWVKNFFSSLGILQADHGGTGVNNGANNLTVPATGTAALLGTANVFTALNTFRNVVRIEGTGGNNGVLYLQDVAGGNVVEIFTGSDEAADRTLVIPPLGADKYFACVANASGLVSVASEVTGVLPSANGGTGVNNAGTLTNGSNTTITGGGTFNLGGFTLVIGRTATLTAPTADDSSADVIFGTSATNKKALVLQGKNGQTQVVFEVQDYLGGENFYVTAAGHAFGYFYGLLNRCLMGNNFAAGTLSQYQFSNGIDADATADTGLKRFSAGVIAVTDGGTGIAGLMGGGAAVASATALPLPTGNVFHVTGTTTITSITSTNFKSGAVITLIFDGILTFTDGSNLKLAGNFVTTADDTITLVYDGSSWYEIARSVN